MNRDELERAFSAPRFNRFVHAANGDVDYAFKLYKKNLRISSRVFASIAVFEVIFRNAIDRHYKECFKLESSDLGWLFSQSGPNGFLAKSGCEKSRANVLESIQKFGEHYVHDHAVANLGFAFWRNLFNAKEFSAANDSLLQIFPNKPHGLGLNQTYVYKKLHLVNDMRNRIAHHDPICFVPKTCAISFELPLQTQQTIAEFLSWLGFSPETFLDPLDLHDD